jgi:hypothetical protein
MPSLERARKRTPSSLPLASATLPECDGPARRHSEMRVLPRENPAFRRNAAARSWNAACRLTAMAKAAKLVTP